MPALERELREELERLEAAGLRRSLRALGGPSDAEVDVDGRPMLLLSSNNYLGLATHPALRAAARAATDAWGCGAGASRLIAGHLGLHAEVEAALAGLKGTEAALLFPSGYQANVGTITALVGRGDHVFSDELNHASIIDGCRLSRATVHVYPHNDVSTLERLLACTPPGGRRLVVTDSVFSMDGDRAPLRRLVAVARHYHSHVMVDEAHATGVLGATGAGALEHFGLEGRVPVVMGTLSKALGAQGGYVAGDRALCDYLRTRDRGFVFTTALAPAAAGAAMAALDVVRDEPERRARLHALVGRLVGGARALGYAVLPTDSAVVGVLIGEAADALAVGASLRADRVWAPAIRPPSVPVGTARMRLTVMATHEDRHIDWALDALARARSGVAA